MKDSVAIVIALREIKAAIYYQAAMNLMRQRVAFLRNLDPEPHIHKALSVEDAAQELDENTNDNDLSNWIADHLSGIEQ